MTHKSEASSRIRTTENTFAPPNSFRFQHALWQRKRRRAAGQWIKKSPHWFMFVFLLQTCLDCRQTFFTRNMWACTGRMKAFKAIEEFNSIASENGELNGSKIGRIHACGASNGKPDDIVDLIWGIQEVGTRNTDECGVERWFGYGNSTGSANRRENNQDSWFTFEMPLIETSSGVFLTSTPR